MPAGLARLTGQRRNPAGLLAYLALGNGMLPGYQTDSRFGVGQVAPVTYLRSYA